MREIKFRAFNGKEMITPTAVINGMAAINKPADDDRGMTDDEGVNYYCNWDMDVVTDYPLMQYTGLKDQNGVEIYEGDVVSLDNRETFKEFKWVGCGYFFDDDSPISDYTNIEVIGNIYENKELIK